MESTHKSNGRKLVPFTKMFERMLGRHAARPEWWPGESHGVHAVPLDIYEDGNDLMVDAALPGVHPDDIHVEVHDKVLRIWGEIREEVERKNEDYHRRENRYGRLERSIELPVPVESEAATAEFENGMVTLRLPQAAKAPSKKIEVRPKHQE